MQGKQLVSVIMPTYHQPQYLRTSVLGVMAQTYPNVELIIVPVEGDVETLETLRLLQLKHLFGPVIVSPKADVIHQFNLGLKNAKGKYMTEAASDDFALPGKIENEVQLIEKRDALLVSSLFFIGDENLNLIGVTNVPEFSYETLIHKNYISDCSLVHRLVFEEFGLFNESLGVLACFDKWLHVAEKYPDRMVQNPVPTWIYRSHPQQLHKKRLDEGKFDMYRKVVEASLKRKGIEPPENMEFRVTKA